MTTEEAQRIVAKVKCRCDGYGVVPGTHGAVPCPDCDGKFVTNDELKEARLVLGTRL
jgi:hypothetical protein